MGLFTKLLRAVRPLEIEDEFFGHLTYMKMPKGRISYWEAARIFVPRRKSIELFIDAPAPELPPALTQREFFLAVESDFPRVQDGAARLLQPELEKSLGHPISASFSEEFMITSISIPNAPLIKAAWDASFESRSDQNHLCTVKFEGFTAIDLEVSG